MTGKGRKKSQEKATRASLFHLQLAEQRLDEAKAAIEAAENALGTDRAMMLGCFASNTLEGSRALIRELREEAAR